MRLLRLCLVFLICISLLAGCGETTDVPDATPVAESTQEEGINGVDTEATAIDEPEDANKDDLTQNPDAESSGETDTKSTATSVEISFDYSKTSTHASNQMAIWIEDAEGTLVKTLFVTNFTAGRRGYESRPDALANWVAKANPAEMTDTEIDALSSATPSSGMQTYSWDLTGVGGERVPDGTYIIKAEATLLWTSYVMYTAEFNTGTAIPGEVEVTEYRSEPENEENAEMIQNVRIVLQ